MASTKRTIIALALCLAPCFASAGTITRSTQTTAAFDYHWGQFDTQQLPPNTPPLVFATFDFRDAPLADLDSINRIDITIPGGAYKTSLTEGPGWSILLDGNSAPLGPININDPYDGVEPSFWLNVYEQIRASLMSDGMLVATLGSSSYSGGLYMNIGTATLSISGPNVVPEPSSFIPTLVAALCVLVPHVARRGTIGSIPIVGRRI